MHKTFYFIIELKYVKPLCRESNLHPKSSSYFLKNKDILVYLDLKGSIELSQKLLDCLYELNIDLFKLGFNGIALITGISNNWQNEFDSLPCS